MTDNPHQFTRDAWEANAEVWDARMGDDGNDFFNVLCWPALVSLLDASSTGQKGTAPPLTSSRGSFGSAIPLAGQHILDIACGNGLTSRRLAALGAQVTAFDFSANLIERAKARSPSLQSPILQSPISYHVVDATNEDQLLSLGPQSFDSALSNMALFDMADIETLFRTLPKLLKPGGAFVFSLTHPAFNNAASMHVMEEFDDGEIKTIYSVKISRYMSIYHAQGLALRGQPKPQMYFERPLQYYLNLGFQNGFVLDGFEERAFPPDHPQSSPLGWGGKFSEIPPVLVVRLRLKS
ncbi:MAG TPA: class I SAM-dependent methyltransferase [Anaerolineales bacterium]|nr:class I SAM-dependent methyltransferase [Anaerolineales bacterium]